MATNKYRGGVQMGMVRGANGTSVSLNSARVGALQAPVEKNSVNPGDTMPPRAEHAEQKVALPFPK